MKLYGFTKTLSFFCVCWGSKGMFFGMAFGKKDRKLHFYKGHTTAEDVIFHNRNTYPKWWFVGIMINDSEKGFIDYDRYYMEE